MFNSWLELSKIEKKNESFSIKLPKIERILSCHSWKSRVEREMETIKETEREISLSTLDFSLESETLVNAWALTHQKQ